MNWNGVKAEQMRDAWARAAYNQPGEGEVMTLAVPKIDDRHLRLLMRELGSASEPVRVEVDDYPVAGAPHLVSGCCHNGRRAGGNSFVAAV